MKSTYIVIPFFILILFGCDLENGYSEAEVNSSRNSLNNVTKEQSVVKKIDIEENKPVDTIEENSTTITQGSPLPKPNNEIIEEDEQEVYNPDYRTQEEINDEENSEEVVVSDENEEEELSSDTAKIEKSKEELEDEKLDGD